MHRIKANGLSVLILLAFSHPAWAIYGPNLTRADASIALRACQEANFAQGREIEKAMRSSDPKDILGVLGKTMKEWRNTPASSALHSARAFCLHEIVPARLQPGGTHASPTRPEPTATVQQFGELGIEYFYYGPDDEFTLKNDPVNLEKLAMEHQDSPWGQQAFLMMTRLGWSWGGCAEGPDQFREVIKRGETFLSKYPASEVSDRIRLEVANAYATWWNVANMEPDAYTDPRKYKAGAAEAKRRAIELYQQFLSAQKNPKPEVAKRLKNLQESPKGSNEWNYFCADYED
jgi:hypothetical protein